MKYLVSVLRKKNANSLVHMLMHAFQRDITQGLRFFMKWPAPTPAMLPQIPTAMPEPNKSKHNNDFHEKSGPRDIRHCATISLLQALNPPCLRCDGHEQALPSSCACANYFCNIAYVAEARSGVWRVEWRLERQRDKREQNRAQSRHAVAVAM